MRDFRAPARLVRRYRAAGLWRQTGPVSDLLRWSQERPDATAIVQYRDGAESRRVTYAEYAALVERFAAALRSLGVGAGDVVAIWLPNLWQVSALMVACARIDAVTAPILPTIRARELGRILARLDATVCVTMDEWAGYGHAAALASVAPKLPALRHRVVVGKAAEDEIDFGEYFERTPWEERFPTGLADADEDPDRLALILFTSGTSGEQKAVLHSFNTIYAGVSAMSSAEDIRPGDTLFIPHSLAFIGGILYGIAIPLLTGVGSVLLDDWKGETALRAVRETGVTAMFAAPAFFHDLLRALSRDPLPRPPLRLAVTGATTVPTHLVRDVPRALGLPLRTLWGMTEVAAHTWTRDTDPAGWGARSDGSPGSGLEIDLRTPDDGPARLFVRGAGVTLATMGRDTGHLSVLDDHDDGWYDTGDLAVDDGRGGIRIMGRVADRIGDSFMIPVSDVENLLREHPAIDDVAVVGYLDEAGAERACAVIAAHRPVPTLKQLRAFLTEAGMTEWYQPSRLEVMRRLPRNNAGKVRKDLLREMVQTGGGLEAL
ncbi:AMP-binding protein [Actinoplanes solisilvae]|uniref:AMP-binding protein n=1 Tax=Actinoplanes solisilvae TaxID=2486853 RepID=UPI0013E2E217|nr:AMP-binding protein [Actinoplanes solisilvae]